jgi:hypothetical protein
VTATFDPTVASDWKIGTSAGNSTTGATDSYVAVANTGGSYTGGTYPSPTTPGGDWAFNDIALDVAGIMNSPYAGSQVQVVMHICIDATTTVSCSAANTATITATLKTNGTMFSYQCSVGAGFTSSWGTCAGGSPSATDITLSVAQPTEVAVSDVYSINRVNISGATVTLTDFANIFGQMDPPDPASTPEPTTFVLLGSALAGLGFFSRRRRKA